MRRTKKFYEEIIGLQPKKEYAGGIIYECGGRSIYWGLMIRINPLGVPPVRR
jgi:catechol-2,3-dioxygenase